jgi:cyclophilin family peptidyl-prolyl cis-trans isomerase
MSQLANKETPEERPDALFRAAQKFQARPAFYMGLVAVALIAALGVQVATSLDQDSGEDHFSPVWGAYVEARNRVAQNQPANAELARLDEAVEDAKGSNAEASALWLSAIAQYGSAYTREKLSHNDRKPYLEAAQSALTTLREKRFDQFYFPPAQKQFFTTGGEPPVEDMLKRVSDDLAWSKQNSKENPEPDAAPIAVLRTDAGDIRVKFFSALAPKHVKNFVTLARAGTYNGTAFHFVDGAAAPTGISGGDPLSYFYNDPLKKMHILRWGKGGTGYDLPPEPSRFRIVHKRAILTAQRRDGADWDNGAQFQILLDTVPRLDRTYSPFAQVIDGMDVADKIAKGRTAQSHGPFRDDSEFQALGASGLIVEPTWIQKVIVYNAEGDALAHSYPLSDGEKKLSTLKDTPLKPLSGAELRAKRTLVVPAGTPTFRRGLDIPFPSDLADPSAAKPEGERRVAENVSATGTSGSGDDDKKKDADSASKDDGGDEKSDEKKEPAKEEGGG